MRRKKITPTILIVFGILFASCGIKRKSTINDYSLFPRGTVLSGKMEAGKTLYLVREESTAMMGVCFVDNNQAITEVVSYIADSTGKTTFIQGKELFTGKMTVNKALNEIELTLPKISSLSDAPQKFRLSYAGTIPECLDCQERYKNPVFENMVAEKNIQYGAALGYYTSKPSDYISKDDYRQWFKEMFNLSRLHHGFLFKFEMKKQPLLLDVYQPENDTIGKRPLLLFIHGGAFFFGDKENKLQQVITEYAVKRGFMVAAINYRLGTSITPGSIERTIYRDVQDTRAALRYLMNRKDVFGIDENQIYLSGSSAGGIISLTTAFMDSYEVYSSTGSGLFNQRENLGGLDDSGNTLKNSFKIAGVASMWGGVTNLAILNNNIPTLLIHGTADDVIPCDEGLPLKNFMPDFIHRVLSRFGKCYGSDPIYHRLRSLDIPVKYVPFPGEGHDLYIESDESLNNNIDIICDELGEFLYDNISKRYFNHRLSGDTIVGKNNSSSLYKLDNLGKSTVQWHVEGGFITQQTNESIRVIWYDVYKTGTVTACITDEYGVSCKKELKVTIHY